MTRPVPRIEVTKVSSVTVTVRGNRAADVLRRAGCPRQFKRPPGQDEPCWLAPVWATDAIAAAAHALGGYATTDQPDLWGEAG